jgi:hypothetical protein
MSESASDAAAGASIEFHCKDFAFEDHASEVTAARPDLCADFHSSSGLAVIMEGSREESARWDAFYDTNAGKYERILLVLLGPRGVELQPSVAEKFFKPRRFLMEAFRAPLRAALGCKHVSHPVGMETSWSFLTVNV